MQPLYVSGGPEKLHRVNCLCTGTLPLEEGAKAGDAGADALCKEAGPLPDSYGEIQCAQKVRCSAWPAPSSRLAKCIVPLPEYGMLFICAPRKKPRMNLHATFP